ncbi:MAG TPA: molybdopterin molybdotransferase MoeA [Dermatophilaceae bacterium]|nr:molybdopterin molybdotransferase MoeA [Dermatophilaceae bacterium]
MRTVEEHRDAALALVAPLPPVRVPLGEALGLVAAEPVVSLVDLPGFDNSAMDGYAVRAADVAGAGAGAGAGSGAGAGAGVDAGAGEADGTSVRLPVVADLAAGDPADAVHVGPGQAARIMTGAPVPAGADTIVKVEDTDGGATDVEIHVGAPAGTSIRRRGEDLAAGGEVLAPGAVLTPRRLALLAASGHGEVLCHPRPRVAVLSTGAELVDPGKPLRPGQIHDSNSIMLEAAVTAAGARAAYRGHVGDHPDEVRALLARLAGEVDVVITSGGVSMGVHDVVKAVLREDRELGAVDFVQVAMQPGKPQGLGVLHGVGGRGMPFFGLPGNPVSSYVSFEVFVRPVLRRLMGLEPAVPPTVRAALTAPLRSPAGRRQIARAVLTESETGWLAEPVAGQGSHFVADLAASTGLLLVPEEVTTLAAGAQLDAIVLDR